jgi:uncharacterized protein YwqG
MHNSSDPLAELSAVADKHNLAPYKHLLQQHVLFAVGLIPASADDSSMPVGATKLGGEPDAPPDFEWPIRKERPLGFIAQINLSEIPVISGSLVPAKGLLSFFYDDQVWGFDPNDKDGFKVFYFAETASLKRIKTPVVEIKKRLFGLFPQRTQTPKIYQSCRFEPKVIATLPEDVDVIGLPEDAEDDYFEMLEDMEGHHRLLGHCEPIQNPMEIECELVTNGFYCGDSSGYKEASKFEETSKQWRLLLQIDSDIKHTDMMWGDAGRLYYWIKEKDLESGNFQNCWLISQCS